MKVYRLAIHWNHLHLSVKGGHFKTLRGREGLQNFFRVVAGHTAQEILRQFPFAPGIARRRGRKFWDDLLFTRIVEWGRDFICVSRYIERNAEQAIAILRSNQIK